MKNLFVLFIFLFLFSCEEKPKTLNASLNTPKTANFKLEPILENCTAPVYLTNAGDARLFIVSQNGMIHILKNGKLLDKPFLDISSKVRTGSGYTERGLLGMAFHPQYKSNGRFFLYYSVSDNSKGMDHKTILTEYKVSSSNQDIAAPQEKVLLEIPQPESNHNGGQLAFGPDGYLYLASGDGGGAGDEHGDIGNAQNLENLLGKILRIDVNSGNPYGIPKDNPFAKGSKNRKEIYAFGLRNPWRFSFDRMEGVLFCGDVGQNSFEEINIVERGKNYGWRAMEGNSVFDKGLVKNDMVPPIHDYPRSVGVSIIGGYVYRGKQFPEWEGDYFFADWNGRIYLLEKGENNTWTRKDLSSEINPGFTINSFGEDHLGELYVMGQKEIGTDSKSGIIYKLTQVKVK